MDSFDSRPNLFSRNWGFISETLQRKLAAARLLIAGTGLGSVAALQAARIGFGEFILADGDTVDLSNLNRQQFDNTQIGMNKAAATAANIHRINPEARIEVIDRYLDCADFGSVTERADITLNTIDWGDHAFIHLNRAAREKGRTVLFPLNIGWGGALYILTPDAPGDEEPTRWLLEADEPPAVIKRRLILHAIGPDLPAYLNELLPAFLADNEEKWPYDPQMAPGAALTAALIVRAAVALVAGEPVRHVPDVAYVDFARLISE